MRVVFMVAFCAVLAASASATSVAQTLGHVITAKTGQHALLVWDATDQIAQMVQTKAPADKAMPTLESQAMTIAGDHASALGNAETITVRVFYSKTGAVNPAYGTPTFAGIETVFNLTVPAKSAKTDSAALAQSLAKGTTPKDVTIAVTGKLPPM